jgi:hypothetical protein
MSDTNTLDPLDRTAIFLNAHTSPFSPPDRDVNKRKLHAQVDETFRTLGEQMDTPLEAPAFKPSEDDNAYYARVATAAAAFGPPERRGLKRDDMIAQQLALEARIDLDNLQQETIRPLHSLLYDELRAVTKTDRSGRPMTGFYSRRGPSVWMDAFADRCAAMCRAE